MIFAVMNVRFQNHDQTDTLPYSSEHEQDFLYVLSEKLESITNLWTQPLSGSCWCILYYLISRNLQRVCVCDRAAILPNLV